MVLDDPEALALLLAHQDHVRLRPAAVVDHAERRLLPVHAVGALRVAHVVRIAVLPGLPPPGAVLPHVRRRIKGLVPHAEDLCVAVEQNAGGVRVVVPGLVLDEHGVAGVLEGHGHFALHSPTVLDHEIIDQQYTTVPDPQRLAHDVVVDLAQELLCLHRAPPHLR